MLPSPLKGPVEEGDSQFNALVILLLLEEDVRQEVDSVQVTAVHLDRSLQVRLRLNHVI